MENSWRGSKSQTLAHQSAENPGRKADRQQIGSLPMEHKNRVRREARRISPRSHSRLETKHALSKSEV